MLKPRTKHRIIVYSFNNFAVKQKITITSFNEHQAIYYFTLNFAAIHTTQELLHTEHALSKVCEITSIKLSIIICMFLHSAVTLVKIFNIFFKILL